jgi:predicted site-specific integrase-resolvase
MRENILIEKQQWLDIPHACQVTGVSTSTMRLFIKAGVLRACQLKVPGKVWGKWIINKESLLGYLDRLAAKQRKEVTTNGEE